MKRILSFTLLTFLCVQDATSSFNNNNNEAVQDGNRLKAVLTEILPNVKIDIVGDQVELIGTQVNIDAAVARLRDYQGLRAVLLPVNNSKSLAAAKAMDVKTWDDFLQAAGVDESANELFNTKAECVTDANGVFTISTPSRFNQRMVQPYLDSLQESSQFFVWARTNVPGFVVQQVAQTSIHYGLLREFLYLKADTSAQSDSSDVVARFSTQNAVKSLVAAVSGNVALQQVSEGQYRVQAISLGDAYDIRSAILEIVVDRSGSMGAEQGTSGIPIDFVNRQLPALFSRIAGSIAPKQSLTVRLSAFNTGSQLIGTYVLQNNSPIPPVSPIVADGGTNLTLIAPFLNEGANERKLVIGFTDGNHEYQGASLSDSLETMRQLQGTGKFSQIRLCKVGNHICSYFDEVSSIFGGGYSTEATIEDFFTTISGEIKELMRSKSPLVVQLAGSEVKVVEWMHDDQPGIFASNQVVGEGAYVKFKGQEQKVENPAVDQAALIAKLKSAVAALEEAQKKSL